MKLNRFFIIGIILTTSLLSISAEDTTDLIDSDLDSLFSDTPESEEDHTTDTVSDDKVDQIKTESSNEVVASVLEDLATKTGFTFIAKYAFVAGLAPGWDESPFYMHKYNTDYSTVVGADIGSDFTLDFQLTPAFRVKQVYRFRFPDFQADVEEFWGSYNLFDTVYFKMGKQKVKWGLGRNYNYTNLTTRIPDGSSGGDTYAFQATKPIGVGGLEFLTMVRSGFIEGDLEDITAGDMAYGFKYNFASQLFDLNWGTLYHSDMDLRSFLSFETTINKRTELYAETLVGVNQKTFDEYTFSGSIGFFDQFFNKRFSVNIEYFYNGEKSIAFEDEDQGIIEVELSPYVYGHNIAMNLAYKPKGNSTMRPFVQGMYNTNENTGKILPGVRFKPMDSFSVYFAVPLAFGDRDGTYYRSNYDDDNRPFSVTMAIRLDGQFKVSKYQ